jgi:hypothetical protein
MGCNASDQSHVSQPANASAPLRATGQTFPRGTVSFRLTCSKYQNSISLRCVFQPSRTKPAQRLVIDSTLIERFVKIQAEVDQYDHLGVFDALMVAEEEVDALRKQKSTSEISYKVLCEKTKKEKLDFDAVTKAVNIGTFFKDSATQNKLISKEEVN